VGPSPYRWSPYRCPERSSPGRRRRSRTGPATDRAAHQVAVGTADVDPAQRVDGEEAELLPPRRRSRGSVAANLVDESQGPVVLPTSHRSAADPPPCGHRAGVHRDQARHGAGDPCPGASDPDRGPVRGLLHQEVGCREQPAPPGEEGVEPPVRQAAAFRPGRVAPGAPEQDVTGPGGRSAPTVPAADASTLGSPGGMKYPSGAPSGGAAVPGPPGPAGCRGGTGGVSPEGGNGVGRRPRRRGPRRSPERRRRPGRSSRGGGGTARRGRRAGSPHRAASGTGSKFDGAKMFAAPDAIGPLWATLTPDRVKASRADVATKA